MIKRKSLLWFSLCICILLPSLALADQAEGVTTVDALVTPPEQSVADEAIPDYLIPEEQKPAPEIVLHTLPGEELYKEVLGNLAVTEEIKPGPLMTLEQALLAADAQNLDLELARVKLETAEAQLKQAWALILPNVSGEMQWAHLGRAPVADLMGMQLSLSPSDTVNASLTFGLNLINVAAWYRLHMAQESQKVVKLGIEQGRQALLAGVAQVYLAALMTGEVVKIQREQVNSALERLEIAEGRLQAGVGVRLDVIQAEFNLENSKQNLIDAIWAYEGARDALAGVTNTEGLPVPQTVPLGEPESFEETELIEEALQQNREMKVVKAQVELMELQRKATVSEFFPSLSGAFVSTYSITKPAMMGSQDRLNWTLAVVLKVPLFDYSKYGALDEHRANIKEAEVNLRKIALSTKLAVREARRDYFSSVLAVDNAKRQVDLTEEGLALSNAAYKNGAATYLEVNEAQRNYNSASIAYVTKTIQAQLAFIQLKAAVGRDIMANVF